MNIDIEKLRQNILKIQGNSITERTYYPIISTFLMQFATSQKLGEIDATQEESPKEGVGFPDITIRRKKKLIGWMEVKLPDDDLNNKKFDEQFKKYKDALENIIFTNLRQWQLWQWDDKGAPIKILDITFDPTSFKSGEEKNLEDLLIKFFEGKAYEAKTPKQLALALAKKTRLFSKQVEESYDETDDKSDLAKLKNTFEKTLIQNIDKHQFANMVAETMAYSLFLAFLEHVHRGNGGQLTLTSAIDYLPKNVPILADLYQLVSKIANKYPRIFNAAESLIDQLNNSDIKRIHSKLVDHKVGEDPVIQFYEPFLKEYDPKERKARGVYYTPKPVVDFIVRSVDQILRDKFGKEKGLADQSVHILDPATGTGTFLMSAIQQVYETVKKENISMGEAMVQKQFIDVVINHILKHFYGFELMVAPYAVAHLKLTLLLEELGFNFSMTAKDDDPDNDRIKVYLANTLDDPEMPMQNLFGFDSIPKESEIARKIKKEAPVLVIIGNPPYSVSSSNKSEWIEKLMKDYKSAVKNEKNIQPLSDDYIKFVRFGQWKIYQNGQGIFAMITNHSFINGSIHRGMREELLKTYNKIYVLDLHGNSTIGEQDPNGGTDENVFNIQQGVSISIFIKNASERAVYYSELWGDREKKFNELICNNLTSIKWRSINPNTGNGFSFCKAASTSIDAEYSKYYPVEEMFNDTNVGVATGNDDKYVKGADELFKFSADPNLIKDYYFRPFDKRKIYYDRKLIQRARYPLMKNMLSKNLGICLLRGLRKGDPKHYLCSAFITDRHCLDNAADSMYLFPLYIKDENGNSQSGMLFAGNKEITNYNRRFIDFLENQYSVKFTTNDYDKNDIDYGGRSVLYYIYSILYCPTYRTRYREQLKNGFPRLPITKDKKLFSDLVQKGNELVNLHLLGENPFDKSTTIFDDNSKWNVQIGGEKPDNLDDWKVTEVRYDAANKRVYVNPGQYFEGVERDVWEFMIGGYQVCEKWLKDRKKAERRLSTEDLKHYMKIVVSLRETIRVMGEIDKLITKWPME